MGQLPAERVTPDVVFSRVGIDHPSSSTEREHAPTPQNAAGGTTDMNSSRSGLTALRVNSSSFILFTKRFGGTSLADALKWLQTLLHIKLQ